MARGLKSKEAVAGKGQQQLAVATKEFEGGGGKGGGLDREETTSDGVTPVAGGWRGGSHRGKKGGRGIGAG